MKNKENIEHKEELHQLGAELNLIEGADADYQLVCDLSNEDKIFILQSSNVCLYTPIGEHFGIVPLESMAASTPVVAMASGGPLETVVHDETGLLVNDPFSELQVAKELEKFILDPELASRLGSAGNSHVEKKFSFEAFSNQLEKICLSRL